VQELILKILVSVNSDSDEISVYEPYFFDILGFLDTTSLLIPLPQFIQMA
jgi:cadmium resistance protein CadD (predicted permease)